MNEYMTPNERIEELEEMKSEYVLNESILEDDNPSWGELAEAQAVAESAWDDTEEGQELKALLWAEGNEKVMLLYYALKTLVDVILDNPRLLNIIGSHHVDDARDALRKATGE